MTDFYVRCGEDVQPYMERLAAEHITTVKRRCHRIGRKIMDARRRNDGVAVITKRVRHAMMNGEACSSFHELGFHFLLREAPGQRANARKREFILSFATRPRFAPEDMPRRLRKRNGKASARPVKKAKKRPKRGAPSAPRNKPKRPSKAERVLSFLHNKMTLVGAMLSRLQRRLYEMADMRRIRELYECAVTMWRRRPHGVFAPRSVKAVLTSLYEIPATAPAHAWVESRLFGEAIPLWLSTVVRSDSAVDWDAFPFGRFEESERLPA